MEVNVEIAPRGAHTCISTKDWEYWVPGTPVGLGAYTPEHPDWPGVFKTLQPYVLESFLDWRRVHTVLGYLCRQISLDIPFPGPWIYAPTLRELAKLLERLHS